MLLGIDQWCKEKLRLDIIPKETEGIVRKQSENQKEGKIETGWKSVADVSD